jgi:hypothetical protein
MARDDADTPATGTPEERRLRDALANFRLAAEAEDDQRKREEAVTRFYAGDQWEAAARDARKQHVINGVLVTGRPTLTINKLKGPVNLTFNQMRLARLGHKITPNGAGADKKTADVIRGLIRHIEVTSKAHIARNWAYLRGLKAGRGWYRIVKQYANDGDFDQDLTITRILNQFSVYPDPWRQSPNGSDMEWCWIVEDIPLSRFKRLYGESKLSSASEDDLRGYADESPGWTSGSGPGRSVRVGEYFYVEHRKRWLVDGETELREKKPTREEGVTFREVDQRTVKHCLCTCAEIMEETEWDGRFIPVLEFIADEDNINGERIYKGLVEDAMDAQRSYNAMRSSQVETVLQAPRFPWLIAEGTIEGYERMWQESLSKGLPYVYYKQKDLEGQPAPPPQRNVQEPAIQAVTMAVREADGDIKATTQVFDPSLGNLSAQERSGRAIAQLQQQGERANSGYLEQFTSVTMVHEGELLVDLLPKIYDRPGRIAKILGLDDEPQTVMLGMPFSRGQDGEPVAVPELQQAAEVGAQLPKDVEYYDLKRGQYAVTVTVGKGFATERQEGASAIGDLIQAAPALTPTAADIWIGNMDFPGAPQLAERLKKQGQKAGAIPPDEQQGQPDLPPEVAQQMQQAMQLIQAQAQQLNALTDKLQSEEAKLQAQIQIKQMELASREQIAAMQVQADLTQTLAKLQTQEAIEHVKAQIAKLKADYTLVDHRESRIGQAIAQETVGGGNGEVRP